MQRIEHTPGAHERGRSGATPGLRHLVHAMGALAAAGAGLLVWLALSSALLHGRGADMQRLVQVQCAGLGLALVLASLVAPALLRAAPSRPRDYARIAWPLALLAGVAVLALRLWPGAGGAWLGPAAGLACLGALVALATLPWLDAAPPGSPTSLRLPLQLVLGLLCGAALLFALVAVFWPGPMPAAAPLPSLLLLGAMVAALLLADWHANGGLRVAFADRIRVASLVLLVLLPWLLTLALYLDPRWPRLAWPAAALSILAGAVLEQAGRRDAR